MRKWVPYIKEKSLAKEASLIKEAAPLGLIAKTVAKGVKLFGGTARNAVKIGKTVGNIANTVGKVGGTALNVASTGMMVADLANAAKGAIGNKQQAMQQPQGANNMQTQQQQPNTQQQPQQQQPNAQQNMNSGANFSMNQGAQRPATYANKTPTQNNGMTFTRF